MHLKNICAIDGSYCLHRVMKQQNLFDLRNSELERTGGIFGVLNILKKEIQNIGNYFPIVCWDDGQSDRRLAIYDNYKKHREHLEDPERKPFSEMTEDELDEDYVYNYKLQRKKLIQLLNSFGIPNLFFRHTEGDDLIYWLVKHSERCKIITDDKDMLQLLNENCIIRRPMHDDVVRLDSFLKDNEFESIDDFVKMKALLGDGSDNIPSACFKVGEKTASEFFKVYESVKADNLMDLFSNEAELKKYCVAKDFKFKKAYCNFNENQYLNNLELVDLKRVQDSEFNDEAIYDAIRKVYKNKDINLPLELLNKYEIRTVNTNIIFESLIMARHNIKED